MTPRVSFDWSKYHRSEEEEISKDYYSSVEVRWDSFENWIQTNPHNSESLLHCIDSSKMDLPGKERKFSRLDRYLVEWSLPRLSRPVLPDTSVFARDDDFQDSTTRERSIDAEQMNCETYLFELNNSHQIFQDSRWDKHQHSCECAHGDVQALHCQERQRLDRTRFP